MQYADNRALRERMYRAYVTRASESGTADLNNTPLMAQILMLRAEEAQMLGFANFAELSLATKMATTPRAGNGFPARIGAARAAFCRTRSDRIARIRQIATRPC